MTARHPLHSRSRRVVKRVKDRLLMQCFTGRYKRLSVHVSSYDPRVRCAPPRAPPAPQTSDCNLVIDQMSTSKDLKDFGPMGYPHLDFVVPYSTWSRT